MALIVKKLKNQLDQDNLSNKFKTSPQYFQRKRLLPLKQLAILILRGQKLPFQNALNKFFSELGKIREVPTASAYCQAREKLKPEFFKEINDIANETFYSFRKELDCVKL